jgi:hypothetical protein
LRFDIPVHQKSDVVSVKIDANLYDIDFHPVAVDLFADGGNYRPSGGLLVQQESSDGCQLKHDLAGDE